MKKEVLKKINEELCKFQVGGLTYKDVFVVQGQYDLENKYVWKELLEYDTYEAAHAACEKYNKKEKYKHRIIIKTVYDKKSKKKLEKFRRSINASGKT